jgi:hypothetical protein
MSRRHDRPGRVTPRQPRIPRADLERVARLHASTVGCSCHIDITIRHDDNPSVTVHHDDDCPAQHARSVLVVLNPKDPTDE